MAPSDSHSEAEMPSERPGIADGGGDDDDVPPRPTHTQTDHDILNLLNTAADTAGGSANEAEIERDVALAVSSPTSVENPQQLASSPVRPKNAIVRRPQPQYPRGYEILATMPLMQQLDLLLPAPWRVGPEYVLSRSPTTSRRRSPQQQQQQQQQQTQTQTQGSVPSHSHSTINDSSAERPMDEGESNSKCSDQTGLEEKE